MDAAAQLDQYWLLLKDLGAKEKLQLIERLVKSLQSGNTQPKPSRKKKLPASNDWAKEMEGAWSIFPETAEEEIVKIVGARSVLSREIESL